MQVTVNGIDFRFSGESAESRIAELEKYFESKNLVVTAIEINGLPFEGDLKEVFKENRVEKLELNAFTPEQLVMDGVRTGTDFLPRLAQAVQRDTELLQEGREGEGTALFVEIIDGFQWLNSICEGVLMYLNSAELDKGIFQQEFDRFKESLLSLLEAWENHDIVLISDILEYEILEFIRFAESAFQDIVKE